MTLKIIAAINTIWFFSCFASLQAQEGQLQDSSGHRGRIVTEEKAEIAGAEGQTGAPLGKTVAKGIRRAVGSTGKKPVRTKKDDRADSLNSAGRIGNWERTWSILARFSSSLDSNLEHRPAGGTAFGSVPSVTAGYQLRSSRHRLRFIYSFAAPRYSTETDLTRYGNYFSTAYRFSLGSFSIKSEGEVSLKGTNEDRETNNQYIVTETLTYRFDKSTRLGVFGAYRIRRYPSADIARNAVNPMIGLKFSRRLGSKADLSFGYRYDENRARGPRGNYVRSKYKIGLDVQMRKEDAFEAEVSFLPRRYRSRFVDLGEFRVPRRDEKWSVDFLWKHDLANGFGVETAYQFQKRTSNDPRKRYRNHQFVVSLTFHWGNGRKIEP